MTLLEKCNAFLREHIEDFYNDDYRLGYHLTSPYGWMNDPHNPVLFNGKYHIFFNLFPFEPEGFRAKFWAHVVSDDMVNFTYLPCAIAPDSHFDKDGCASGCVVVKNGKIYLIYTARSLDRKPKEVQAIAVSHDGIHFAKPASNPIVVTDPVTGENCRDPRVWSKGDVYYMILGNTSGEHGRALLFSSTDLYSWTYEGVFCQSEGSQGFMWECPDYFRINGKDVLIVSSILLSDNTGIENQKTIYITGTLDDTGKKFIQEKCYELDNGYDFYAPQTYDGKDGKKMLIAWMDNWATEKPTKKKGWVGCLTIPRILNINKDGLLEMYPAEELKSLRGKGFMKKDFTVCQGDNVLYGQRAAQFELRFKIDLSRTTAKDIGLVVRESEDGNERTYINFDADHGIVTFDKTRSGEGTGFKQDVKLKYFNKDKLDVVVYVDITSIEILINNGTTSITHRIYPGKKSDLISLFPIGGDAYFDCLEYYALKNSVISFSYDL